ncbi:MAG: hypothetical protein JXA42_02830, partial [Anaerolineales bacterium]|nr:hypothetical protein [Anaerolineales bacterium]
VGYGWQNNRLYHSFKVQQLHEQPRVAPSLVRRLVGTQHQLKGLWGRYRRQFRASQPNPPTRIAQVPLEGVLGGDER